MSKRDELLQMIEEYELVKELHKMENTIFENDKFLKIYQEILKMQKLMVQHEYNGNEVMYEKTKAVYDSLLNGLSSYPLVNEYLNTVEEVNEMLTLVKSIVENEINEGLK